MILIGFADFSQYPIINTLIILLFIVILAVGTAYFFKIKDIFIISLFLVIYLILFYAFNILNLSWLSGGLMLFAIICFEVFGRKIYSNVIEVKNV